MVSVPTSYLHLKRPWIWVLSLIAFLLLMAVWSAVLGAAVFIASS